MSWPLFAIFYGIRHVGAPWPLPEVGYTAGVALFGLALAQPLQTTPRMLNTRGVSSLNDYNTNNTLCILARKTCILLYFIHGHPVFSILGPRACRCRSCRPRAHARAARARGRRRHRSGCAHAILVWVAPRAVADSTLWWSLEKESESLRHPLCYLY